MSGILGSIYNLRLFDELSKRDSVVHRIHPLVHLLVTFIYIICITSFDKYEIFRILPFVFYPIIIFLVSELPLKPVIKRLLIIEPFIIGIGILNPIFNKELIEFGNVLVSGGWVTFFSIIIKGGIVVSAALLLIALTGIDKLAVSLRMLKVPKILVLQLLLTYRYISVLLEETGRAYRAYSLRAPKQKGINHKLWGMFSGQLILRTFDRAQRVHEAMCIRGFAGEYHTGNNQRINSRDIIYFLSWSGFFIITRIYDVSSILGTFITGVIN
jgi:cobalt/nickel transport system permease protein